MGSVGDRGEAADDRVACDVRNDGRGTPIATLLAYAPDAIRGDGGATAVLMRLGGRRRTRCAGSFYNIAVTTCQWPSS